MSARPFSAGLVRFVSGFAPKIKPYAAKDKDGKDIYINDARLIRIIAKYFRVRYEILTPSDGQFGVKLPGGNWTGMIGMLLRGEADLAVTLALTEERFNAVNFSYPYYYSTISFMTDSPQPMPKYLAIFYPLSYTMWIALALVTTAMSIVFYFLLNRRHSYQRVLLSTVRSTLENAVDFKMTKPAIKMAAFTWILAMVILTSSYKAVLLSFLSFPRLMGIRDILELSRAVSASGSFKCITYPGTYVAEDFARSDDPSRKAIGECLLRNEMSGEPLENFVKTPYGKAYIGGKLDTLPYERRYFVSEDDFSIEIYAILFTSRFCCPEDLNRVLHRLLASGIFEKLMREAAFFTVLQNPSLQPECSEAINVLSLGDMSGAFYILISGWVAGFVTLLIEKFAQNWVELFKKQFRQLLCP